MDFDRLEQAWRSEANTPDAKAQAYLMEELMLMLKARRRGETLLFAIPVAAMTFFTAIALKAAYTGQMDASREWGSLAMLGVCWVMLGAVFVVGMMAKRPRREGQPMRQALEGMLAANRRARANCRIFWISFPAFMVPTLVAVMQLHEVGKATERDTGQMLLLFAVAVGASLGWNTLRYFRVLKPEQKRLEALLQDYGEG